MSDGGEKRCPLCTEEMDLTDKQLKPCKCGYEICVWCWNHIMDMAEKEKTEGRCPACRMPYDKEKIVSAAANCGRLVAEINSGRKQKSQKVKQKTSEGRKHLTDVRVVQRHLSYVMGLPSTLADEDILGRREYFGQYGKVLKVSLSRTAAGAIQYFPNDTCCVYITYSKEEEAIRCIQSVHGYILDGKPLRACFGTTKYCHTWLRNMPCNNPDCLYLHDIGSQEDSFTKDEVVSAYTRSRLPQVTGATSNLQRSSGNLLPPPVDDFSTSGTGAGKPISRSLSNNLSSKLKGSPPDDSSGRSIALPATASWGMRVSNGQPANAVSASSNGHVEQNPRVYNGPSGFSAVVAGVSPASTLDSEGRNKTLVAEGGYVLHPDSDVHSMDYSKRYIVKECEEVVPFTYEEVQDAVSATATSRNCSPASNKADNGNNMLHKVAFSVQPSGKYFDSASIEDDRVAGNRKTLNLCSALSSIGINSHNYNQHSDPTMASEHSDPTKPSDSSSCHSLFTSPTSADLLQSCSEISRGPKTLMSSRSDDIRDVVYDSRGLSDWGSVPQAQILQDTSGAAGQKMLAFSAESSKVSEVNHPSQLPNTSKLLNLSNHSVAHSWQDSIVSGTHDPRKIYTGVEESFFPIKSSDSALSNGYYEDDNKVSSPAELKNFRLYNLSNSERGKDLDPDEFASVDSGESSIISNILSICDESLVSPHNLSKLLSDRDRQRDSFNIASSTKAEGSNQSRFSFARQEDHANEVTDFRPSFFNNRHETNRRSAPQDFQDSQDIYSNKFQNGFSSRLESHTVSNGHSTIPNKFSVCRAQVSAPPGFSMYSKAPPPGFSSQERMDQTLDATTVNHLQRNSSLTRNQYHVQPATNLGSIQDVEFIDPAILAVGRGRLTNGINNLGIDTRSSFSSQLGASEGDLRLQLLMQQSLLGQQNHRYSDHVGDRFSPLSDAYNTPKPMEHSAFAQLSMQHRNAHTSNGWEGWNEVQGGNNMGVAELLGNEKFGFNRYSGYDNLKFQMHNSGSLYNRTFGM